MYLFFHLYMFQATSAHHQEETIVSTHPLVLHTGKVTVRRADQLGMLLFVMELQFRKRKGSKLTISWGSLSLFRVTNNCVLKARVFEMHMYLEPSLNLPKLQGFVCPVLVTLTSKSGWYLNFGALVSANPWVLFDQKLVKLRNKWHFVDKKTEIMQRVLKIQ
jgi:hypothetical protein